MIIGLSILGYGYIGYLKQQDKIKVENLRIEENRLIDEKRKEKLADCLNKTQKLYKNMWNNNCKSEGKDNNCALLEHHYKAVVEYKEKRMDRCIEVYGK